MPSVNKVTLLGHLGGDPEVRYTAGGQAVANFTIATSWGSGDKRETEWHRCIAWNSKFIPWAEQVSKMHKGDLVYAEGRLKTSSWENDGVKRYKTEIVCDRVEFMRAANIKSEVEDDSVFPGLVEARRAMTDPDNEPPF